MNVIRNPLAAMVQAGICPIITNPLWLTFLSEYPEKVGQVLLEAEVPILEIGLRGFEASKALENAVPVLTSMGIHCGVGSVTSVEKALEALRLSSQEASFVVAPDFCKEISTAVQVPYVPGFYTPQELGNLLRGGFSTLKFFPAEDNFMYLKRILAPFSDYSFSIILSGIEETNPAELKKWYSLAHVITLGRQLFSQELVHVGDMDLLREKLLWYRLARS